MMSQNYPNPHTYAKTYSQLRDQTLCLCESLSVEDMALQSMPEASPAKWHLGHTTWFFETVVLKRFSPKYAEQNLAYAYLFNSYYEALGERQPRPLRGLLSRPSVQEIIDYRDAVDRTIVQWLSTVDQDQWVEAYPLMDLGMHHEQQHQELLMTDMLHALAQNPLLPRWRVSEKSPLSIKDEPVQKWIRHAGGLQTVGFDIGQVREPHLFTFDNEGPSHRVWLNPFAMSNRLVTCAEYLTFMQDGGYARADLWLSEGWAMVQNQGWQSPLYWISAQDKRHLLRNEQAQDWQVFGVNGLESLKMNAPVMHLNFYEASAYAAWTGTRLPTEFEWEVMAQGNESTDHNDQIKDLHGKVWQWTRSSYDPYPSFKAFSGVAAEYNGKFMVGQLVLRGSSAFTPTYPITHARHTYRNFFPPATRWQLTGLRLAKDL